MQRPYSLRFFLLDARGEIAVTTDAKADPRAWLPGDHNLSESLTLLVTLQAGEYTLALALADPANRARPFRLAMDAPEKVGRYEVSKVTVK